MRVKRQVCCETAQASDKPWDILMDNSIPALRRSPCAHTPLFLCPVFSPLQWNKGESSSKGPWGHGGEWPKHTAVCFFYGRAATLSLVLGFLCWIWSIDFGLEFSIKLKPSSVFFAFTEHKTEAHGLQHAMLHTRLIITAVITTGSALGVEGLGSWNCIDV